MDNNNPIGNEQQQQALSGSQTLPLDNNSNNNSLMMNGANMNNQSFNDVNDEQLNDDQGANDGDDFSQLNDGSGDMPNQSKFIKSSRLCVFLTKKLFVGNKRQATDFDQASNTSNPNNQFQQKRQKTGGFQNKGNYQNNNYNNNNNNMNMNQNRGGNNMMQPGKVELRILLPSKVSLSQQKLTRGELWFLKLINSKGCRRDHRTRWLQHKETKTRGQ